MWMTELSGQPKCLEGLDVGRSFFRKRSCSTATPELSSSCPCPRMGFSPAKNTFEFLCKSWYYRYRSHPRHSPRSNSKAEDPVQGPLRSLPHSGTKQIGYQPQPTRLRIAKQQQHNQQQGPLLRIQLPQGQAQQQRKRSWQVRLLPEGVLL
jgi:hypothetical protein